MADERERQGREADKAPSAGREADAAQPPNAAEDQGGPEPYPPVRQDEAIERTGLTEQVRSFDPTDEAPTPGDLSGDIADDADTSGSTRQSGFAGPQGDPAEGKP
jgi:hypothetical protein